ncbi:MAG: TolC family protein [candidate division Zixibacteria bacterium]|nr:TolC family protein [candidate division Zixibacteria bacterium]
MSRKLHLSIIIIAILGLTLSVSAETYTLEKCIETALENNYGVIAAKNNYNATRWQLNSAYGRILPSISISTGENQSWSASQGLDANNNPIIYTGKVTSRSGSISIGQTYSGLGLGTYANILSNQAQRKSEYYNLLSTTNELVYTIKQSYFNIVKTKMLVDLSKDAVKRGEEQLKIAQSRYDLGSASLSDVLKAKVLRSNAKLELITAENSFSLAKADLNYKMGIDVGNEFGVVEDFPQEKSGFTYDEAYNIALSNNPSYRKANYDFSSTKAGLLAYKANFLPSFYFNVSHSTTPDDFGNMLDFKMKDASYSVRFGLSYSLFNNFSDYASVQTYRKTVDSQKENLENTRNYVALEVKQAFLDIQQNVEKLKVNEESVAAAQEDLNIVREKYNLGAATIIEVLDAEVSFKEAQINQVQALFDYNLAISRLEKVMGR